MPKYYFELMTSKHNKSEAAALVEVWPLPSFATLGSSVRARGILLEIRARLPGRAKRWLTVQAGELVLGMPEDEVDLFRTASATVARTLEEIESLPVIPREIEDILAISTTERHRWLKDGRLPSAGTRTVKLRGRAKKVTFHVFDPRRIEEMLDGDLVATWREQDAETAAENRRRAAWKAKLTRQLKTGSASGRPADSAPDGPNLIGWEAFEREGLLR